MAQTTFTAGAAHGEDGEVYRVASEVYPPNTTTGLNFNDEPWPNGGAYTLSKHWTTDIKYGIKLMLIRFDTSSLSGTVISAAKIRVYGSSPTYADSRSLLIDYHASSNWPIDESDYSASLSGDAHSGTALSTLTVYGWHEFALGGLENINKTGYTGFRLGISGSTPTGLNTLGVYCRGGFYPPELVVTYNTGYQHKVLGCLPTTIAKIMGIPIANISKFNGV